jgi:hypothetical protein
VGICNHFVIFRNNNGAIAIWTVARFDTDHHSARSTTITITTVQESMEERELTNLSQKRTTYMPVGGVTS